MIDVSGLIFEYPTGRALKGIDLHVAAGSITALVGPNGAGKTTLLRCLAALESPYSGHVTIDGLDTQDNPRAIHTRLGYLPDFFGLYDALSVRQCLAYAARSHGIAAAEVPDAVTRAAARVSLTDRLDQAAGALSRGLRQRLAIGQAIVHAPRVLLLDEPAAGLDPQARRGLSMLLLALRDAGMTLVVSSHILAELEDYCSQMVIIDKGLVAGGGAVQVTDAARTELRIVLAVPRPGLGAFLAGREQIAVIEADDSHALIGIVPDSAAQAVLIKALIEAGFAVSRVHEPAPSLEAAYFKRVGA